MRKYYVVETYQRKGPYNLEELKAYGVSKETMIWCFEFDEPKPAGNIPELSELFVDAEQQQDKQPQKTDEFDMENVSGTPFDIDENPPPPPPDNQENVPPPPPITEQEKSQESIIPPPPPEEQQNLNAPPPVNNQDNVIFQQDSEQERQEQNVIPPPPPVEQNEQKKEQQVSDTQNNQQKSQHAKLKTYNVSSSATMPPMPNTYLALSIITTLFCCLILGVISIVFSSQVKKKYEDGDYEGAQSASKTALILNIIAIIGGLITFATLMIMEN